MKPLSRSTRLPAPRPAVLVLVLLSLLSSVLVLGWLRVDDSGPNLSPTHTVDVAAPVPDDKSWYPNNTTPCDVLKATYGNDLDVNYSSNYTIIFAKICVTPAFESLFYEGLNHSGFFVIGWGGKMGQVPTLFFTWSWNTFCNNASIGPPTQQCTYGASWSGNLSNNGFSGPYTDEYVTMTAGGPIGVRQPFLSSPATWEWIIGPALAIIIVAGVISGETRRRTRIREAVLTEETGPDAVGGPENPPVPSEPESKDTLDDIF